MPAVLGSPDAPEKERFLAVRAKMPAVFNDPAAAGAAEKQESP